MAIEEKVLVTGAFPYDFKDRESGRQVQGCTIRYISGPAANGPDGLGWKEETLTVPAAYFDMVTAVPGFYTVSYELAKQGDGRFKKRGKGLRFHTSVEFVAEVDALAEPMVTVAK